jgi:hypothetical protein
LVTGCSSLPQPQPHLGGPPRSFSLYEASTTQYKVDASAKFEADYEDKFECDLLEEGVVPIFFKIEALSESAKTGGNAKLQAGTWDPRLYLQDGSALRLMEVEEIKGISSKAGKIASKERFSPENLRGELKGYLFFKIEPQGAFDLSGQTITHTVGSTSRDVNLYHSLLGFTVTIDDESYPFYIGIKP